MSGTLEGILIPLFGVGLSTLASGVKVVISRLVLLSVLPMGFHWRLRVTRSVFLPGSLLGIEASLLAISSLCELRSSLLGVVWTRREPFANVGAVLCLLDGPQGCVPAYCVVWFRFRMVRRHLAHRPSEVGRIYRLMDMVREGYPGHGSVCGVSLSVILI